MNFINTHPIFTAFAMASLVGTIIGGAIIYIRRQFGWADSDPIGRREFDRRLENVFGGRESLDDESFYSRFFAQTNIPKDIPIRIRKIFEEHLEMDFSRIAAEDDFSKELNCLWDFDSFANVEIMIALEKEFGVSFSDDEAAETKTLLRIAEMIFEKMQNHPS